MNTFAELVQFPPAAWQFATPDETHGTTVLGLRYDQGVIMLADRRATAGNLIMFDQADKIVALDDETLVAISGSFARSVEMTRFLKHAFKYYRRVTMTELSLEGKLMEISRALANNMMMAMQGIGVFLPIVASYDRGSDSFGLHFFDPAGARFTNHNYVCAGSGSERIRGVFEYLGRTKAHWNERPFDEILSEGLTMLDIAADLDSATGGFQKTLPAVMRLTRDGVEDVPIDVIEAAAKKVLDK